MGRSWRVTRRRVGRCGLRIKEGNLCVTGKVQTEIVDVKEGEGFEDEEELGVGAI